MYHKESYKKNNSEKYHRKTQEIFDKVVENLKNIVNNGDYEKFLKFQKSFYVLLHKSFFCFII